MDITLVVAVADNGVIGHGGAIPWHISDDMKRFKALTLGKPLIVGRKTWDSFPRKPLPGRTNIVVTRDAGWQAAGAVVVHSLAEGIARAKSDDPAEIIVAGGAQIYLAAMPLATRIELTQVHLDPEGDTRLPPFDPAHWREASRESHVAPDGTAYDYVSLTCRGGRAGASGVQSGL